MHIKGPQPGELGHHKHAVARIAQAEKGAPWAQDETHCPHKKKPHVGLLPLCRLGDLCSIHPEALISPPWIIGPLMGQPHQWPIRPRGGQEAFTPPHVPPDLVVDRLRGATPV